MFRRALVLQVSDQLAALKALGEAAAVVANLHLGPFGQRVDNRRADAVQAARHLVSAAAELTARVQLGEHQRHSRDPELWVDTRGDAASIVPHADDVPLQDFHLDFGTDARECLVDRVIDDLIDQVVQAPWPRRPDVHARAFAHRFKPFEYLYVVFIVVCRIVLGVVHSVTLLRLFVSYSAPLYGRLEIPCRNPVRFLSVCEEICEIYTVALRRRTQTIKLLGSSVQTLTTLPARSARARYILVNLEIEVFSRSKIPMISSSRTTVSWPRCKYIFTIPRRLVCPGKKIRTAPPGQTTVAAAKNADKRAIDSEKDSL